MASFVLKIYDSNGDIHRTTINVPSSLEEFTFGQLCEAVHSLDPDADLTRLKWEDPEREQIVLRSDKHLKEAVRCMPSFSNGNHLKIHVVCVPQCAENRFVDVKAELLDDSIEEAGASAKQVHLQNGLVQSEAANKSLVNLPVMYVKAEPLDEPPENAIDDYGLEGCLSTDHLTESLISAAKKAEEKQPERAFEESTQQEPVARSTRKRNVPDGIDAAANDQSGLEKEREAKKRSRTAEKMSDSAKDKKREEDKATVGSAAGTPGGSAPKPQIFVARGNQGQPNRIMITNVPKGTVVTKESAERLIGYLKEQQILPQNSVQMAGVEQPTQPQAAAFVNIGPAPKQLTMPQLPPSSSSSSNTLQKPTVICSIPMSLLSAPSSGAAASPQPCSAFVPGIAIALPNAKHAVIRDYDGRVILLEKDATSGDLQSVCKISEELQERFGINRLLPPTGVPGGSLGQAIPQLVSTASSVVSSINVNTAVTLAGSTHSTAALPNHCFSALAAFSNAIFGPCEGAAAASSNVSQVRETVSADVPIVQKEWREQVSQDLRNHLVLKLVKVFFPHVDLAKVQDESVRRAVVAYSRKEEKEAFEKADNRDEYYRLIAERIHKLQKLQTRLELQQENMQPGDLLKCCTAGSSTLDGAPESTDEPEGNADN